MAEQGWRGSYDAMLAVVRDAVTEGDLPQFVADGILGHLHELFLSMATKMEEERLATLQLVQRLDQHHARMIARHSAVISFLESLGVVMPTLPPGDES
jgi:hypothetical protein